MSRLIHAAYLIAWTVAVSAFAAAAGIVASNYAAWERVAP